MLSQALPRHVVEFLSLSSTNNIPAEMGNLARSHDQVTILFMDIAGERFETGWGCPFPQVEVLLLLF